MTHVERIIPIVKLDLRLMFNSSLCDYSTLVKSARAVPNRQPQVQQGHQIIEKKIIFKN